MAVVLQTNEPPPSNSPADDLVVRSGARPCDRIVIAGAARIELLIALIRRGFSAVSCLSSSSGPHVAKDGCDVLIAPAVRSERELDEILHRLGGALRQHGTLLVKMTDAPQGDGARRLRHMLMRNGFPSMVLLPTPDGTASVWRAEKGAAATARAA